jgi:hypothetical protein
VIFAKFLQYIVVEFTPFISLCPLPPFLELFQQVSFFHFHIVLYISTVFILLYLFLNPPPSHGANPQTGPVLSPCFLFLKKKQPKHFYVFKIQGVSL